MGFDITSWQTSTAERLRQAGDWLKRRQSDAPFLVYGTLGGMALWPLVEAAQAGQLMPVAIALGSVAGGVGSNLIAEQVQRWADGPPDEDEVTDWVVENASNAELREALDAILEKLGAIPQAQAALAEGEREWFTKTLRSELARLGSLARFETVLVGRDQITAQDRSAVATGSAPAIAGDGNIVAGPGSNVIVAEDGASVVVGESPAAAAAAHKRRYLEQLSRRCKALPLAALGGEEGADEEITLDRVYIALNTTTRLPLAKGEKPSRKSAIGVPGMEGEETRPLPALDAAAQSSRLALLGDPGAGKSTFVRNLLAWLAEANLGASPPPGIPADLLPVVVLLRDLALRLAELDLERLSHERQCELLAAAVCEQIVADLAGLQVPDFVPEMKKALLSGQCLLVLDGMDEVPYDARGRVRQAVAAVIGQYDLKRVIVTCRVRSYVGEAVLPGFQVHTLAGLDEEQVRWFAKAWYKAQQDMGRVDAEQAERRAENLASAALAGSLRELSTNPMMLTSMAIVHQREVGLPNERVKLYDLVVDVLLRRWQKHKTGEQGLVASPPLLAFLKNDLSLRAVIEHLAYEAHRTGKGQGEAADLSRGQALTLLEAREYLGEPGLAAEFLNYVDQRAGLLVGRGGELGRPTSYGFLHRTFQEYLAGCYMVGQRNMAREFLARAGEGDYWNLAAQLGAEELFHNRRTTGLHGLLDLAYNLCSDYGPKDLRERRAVMWSGAMAALVGRERVEGDTENPVGGRCYLERLIPHLVDLLASGLPAPERAAAGVALARLGDPRPGVGLAPNGLPDITWCDVPAGPFLMGSADADKDAQDREKPQHELDLPAFQMARYPVTNAQFEAFVQAGGYDEPRYWQEAERVGRWQAGYVKRWSWDGSQVVDEMANAPGNYGAPFNLPNHPVVGVTWYEALAFCYWLTEKLQEAGELGEGERIVLPSEAQWEKAASWVPALTSPPRAGGTEGGRRQIFAWGNEWDPARCNNKQSGIGTTSAVGCFLGGASPYGVMDMIGNVWEWCSSKWGRAAEKPDFGYPYRPDDGREDLEGDDGRILRGGSFYNDADRCRCGCRDWIYPWSGLDYGGFRCARTSL